MIDPTLHPPEFSKAGARAEFNNVRLTLWVYAKVVELEGAYAAQVDNTHHAEQLLDRALNNEWQDCPLGEDDPRWIDVKRAWDKANTWDVGGAVEILLEAL